MSISVHVRPQAGGQRYRLLARRRLANNLETVGRLQHHPQAVAKQRVVVGYQNSDTFDSLRTPTEYKKPGFSCDATALVSRHALYAPWSLRHDKNPVSESQRQPRQHHRASGSRLDRADTAQLGRALLHGVQADAAAQFGRQAATVVAAPPGTTGQRPATGAAGSAERWRDGRRWSAPPGRCDRLPPPRPRAGAAGQAAHRRLPPRRRPGARSRPTQLPGPIGPGPAAAGCRPAGGSRPRCPASGRPRWTAARRPDLGRGASRLRAASSLKVRLASDGPRPSCRSRAQPAALLLACRHQPLAGHVAGRRPGAASRAASCTACATTPAWRATSLSSRWSATLKGASGERGASSNWPAGSPW